VQAVPINKQPAEPQPETLTTGNQFTGSKLAAFPTGYQCKPFPSGSNPTTHRRKVGNVPELLPVQAVPIRKKPTEPQPETLTTGKQAAHRLTVGSFPEPLPVQANHSPKPCIFSFPKQKATASRSHQEATDRTTGAKPTARQLETSPQAHSWQRSDRIPVQAVPIRKKPTEPQPETLTIGNQFTGSQLAAFPTGYQCKPFPSGRNQPNHSPKP